jgi:uncharacterized protein GlcG (DUF336 family)
MTILRSLIATSSFSLLTIGISLAQTSPGTSPQAARNDRPPPITEATDPAALPGDFMDIPQSAQLKVPLGPPAGPRAAQPPGGGNRPNNRPAEVASPPFALALEAAQAAVASCAADGYTVAVAVTDSAGKLKAALAPDGTRNNGVYMALRKDVTVVGFKMATLQVRRKIEADPSVMSQIKPNMVMLPGGIPIMKGDTLIGAISASGAAAYEEEKCAQAGLEKIQSRL